MSRTVICDKAAEAVAGVLTGLRCVRRVYTDHAIFDIDADAGTVRVREPSASRSSSWPRG